MPTLPRIAAFADDLTALRRDFHRHPEIGFAEHRTSARVAELLESWGITVTRGLGGTGVVGVLEGNRPGRSIGLRADMDALPMEEMTNLPYASQTPGVFHGCGHDGHTTILLGAARYLAETRDFAGRAIFIFQPAEEGLGGARAMIRDGLFERFPCDELYGLHNAPGQRPGTIGVKPGAAMAGADFFDITIAGRGSHGANPQDSTDPIVIGAGLIKELQGIVARNVAPTRPAVLSVTKFNAGSAYNVIPDSASLSGTVRYFDDATGRLIAERMTQICAGFATAHACEIDLKIWNVFDVLMNDPVRTSDMLACAAGVVGAENTFEKTDLQMGSEDMADMLRLVPGAYCTLGHGGTVPLHNPGFIFDDAILPVGASLFARLVETRGAAQ
ncbi:M20 aminoacylase family protein [Paenirhodobacter sp. CAU 1674]|uniref:M20 aminoacylase family protein n=1 Tax=Paenirhodobacter sp. CAU 1674 TaxID=3032596 RepID=UPI0023DCAF61|nr:M20 aminoacylase family protein [Paenirhodobacter sp. CAU 1674]MDF2141776.1 M20 family metallopeptidase [Paenirhodobacter sp. CAU 1674]